MRYTEHNNAKKTFGMKCVLNIMHHTLTMQEWLWNHVKKLTHHLSELQ